MTPEWIRTAHESWIGGSDLDLVEHQESHYLLPFRGLTIAISGIENSTSLDASRKYTCRG